MAQPRTPITPAMQVELSPATVAAQKTVAVTRTQTIQAPQAAGKADTPRESRSGTDSGSSLDTRANALNARTNGARHGGPPGQMRGSMIDVTV